MKKILSALLATIMLTSVSQAEIFNVTRMDDPVPDGCGVNDCSLREAIDDANKTAAIDTIELPAGVYAIDLAGADTIETGDLDINTDMVIVGAQSIIDGQELGRIVDIRSEANVTLRNLTLRNANTTPATNGLSNGGALQIAGGSLTLDRVTFSDNNAQTLGGAFYAHSESVVEIDDCLFINNSGGTGAAIYASTGITVRNTVFQGNQSRSIGVAVLTGSTSDSRFEGVTFDQNTPGRFSHGHALVFRGRKLLIDGMIATGNNGDVISVSDTDHSKHIEILNALFDGNRARFQGSSDLLDIRHSSFINNTAGAFYAHSGSIVEIDNCLFLNNSGGTGAAIYASTGITLRNTVFQGNQSGSNGVVFLTGSTSDSRFEGVTFDQNTNASIFSAGLVFRARKLLIDGMIATGNSGGVIFVPETDLSKHIEILNALFNGNIAVRGGAINFLGSFDLLDIRHSSFINNTATNYGGALFLWGGDVEVTNVTFNGNKSTTSGTIHMRSGRLVLRHATFSANQVTALRVESSGVISPTTPPSVELANNLIDGNCYIYGFPFPTVTSLGGNIQGLDDNCELKADSDLIDQTIAQLGLLPLADNDGGTPTHKLASASVARGQGEPTICEMVKVDQLFMKRGSPCNSGADESDTVFRDSFELSKN